VEKNSHTVIQSVEHWKGANGNLIKIIDAKNQETLLAPGLAEGRLTDDPTATLQYVVLVRRVIKVLFGLDLLDVTIW